jgi:Xaa-Pro aminopeptidase
MFEASFGEIVVITRMDDLPFVFVPSYHVDYWKERVKVVQAVYPNSNLQEFLTGPKCVDSKTVEVSSEIPWPLLEQIRSALKGASVQPTGALVSESRLIKSSLEIEAISRAAKVASAGMRTAIESCKPGVRECEVAGEAERAMRMMGAEGFAFSTVVSSGANSYVLQELATTKRIKTGEVVIIDLGATVDGYNSEFTRTVFVKKPPREMADAYIAVYEALRGSIKELRHGAIAGDIDSTARKIVSFHGVPGYDHFTGHGLGTAGWESPSIGAGSKEIIRANMVVAIEPASYVPRIGGVRLEENLIVTKEGATVVTRAPFEEGFI